MKEFHDKQSAIEFLGISVEEFNYYDAKSLILYTLKKGQRLYNERILCNFRDGVLSNKRKQ